MAQSTISQRIALEGSEDYSEAVCANVKENPNERRARLELQRFSPLRHGIHSSYASYCRLSAAHDAHAALGRRMIERRRIGADVFAPPVDVFDISAGLRRRIAA